MAMKAKHAFGSEQDISKALAEGKIDSFDILFLDEKKVGWITKDGEVVIAEPDLSKVEAELATKADAAEVETKLAEKASAEDVHAVEAQIATKANAEEVEAKLAEKADTAEIEAAIAAKADAEKVKALETELASKVSAEEVDAKVETSVAEKVETAVKAEVESAVEAAVKEEVESAVKTEVEAAVEKAVEKTKYEITDVPEGTLVDYRDKEIRVMCPTDAVWTKQSVGAGGDANNYYMTFKTYAPSDDAVGYIEHLGNQVDAEILTNFSIDEHGRRYQPTWLSLAKYDETTDVWNYFGKNSTVNKYIGWDYQIDWYDANDVLIASDCVRINLSNEGCHYEIKPYYVGTMMTEVETKIEEKIAEVNSAYEVIEF